MPQSPKNIWRASALNVPVTPTQPSPDYINNVDVLSESRETRVSTVELLRESSQTPKFCENKFRPHALPIMASLKGIRTIPKEDELFDIC